MTNLRNWPRRRGEVTFYIIVYRTEASWAYFARFANGEKHPYPTFALLEKAEEHIRKIRNNPAGLYSRGIHAEPHTVRVPMTTLAETSDVELHALTSRNGSPPLESMPKFRAALVADGFNHTENHDIPEGAWLRALRSANPGCAFVEVND